MSVLTCIMEVEGTNGWQNTNLANTTTIVAIA